MLRTQRARIWAAGVIGWLIMMAVFGTAVLLTGGGGWGYLIFTALFAVLIVLPHVIPRVCRWIDEGAPDA